MGWAIIFMQYYLNKGTVYKTIKNGELNDVIAKSIETSKKNKVLMLFTLI